MKNYKLELIDIFNQKALFTNGRIDSEDFPRSLYKYDLRENDEGIITAIEPHVYVNHGGTVITGTPINFKSDNYKEFDKESSPNFTGEHITLNEFIMRYISRDTNELMMIGTHELMVKNGAYKKAENIIDYFLPESNNLVPLTNYEFDFCAIPDFGCEGIYLTCYIDGVFDETGEHKKLKCGTYKTLRDDLEAMQIMGELAGSLTYFNHQYVNSNLKRYTPDKELQAESERKNEAEVKNNAPKIRSIKDIKADISREQDNYRDFLNKCPGADSPYLRDLIGKLQDELREATKLINTKKYLEFLENNKAKDGPGEEESNFNLSM